MKVLAHIITIGGLILYLIAKHESNKPTGSAEKSPAMDLPAKSERDTQPQTLNTAVESTNTADTVHSTANTNMKQTSRTPEEQERAKKRTRWKVWLCTAVALGIFFYVKFWAPAATYQHSLRLIEEGDYERAADVLNTISSDKHGSIWLRSYAKTRAKYGEIPIGEDAVYAYDRLESVVKYGEYLPCYDEICQYAERVKVAADEEIQQQRAKFKAGLPYVGMDPEDIHDTKLGRGKLSHSSVERGYTYKLYEWEAADGCTIFSVTVFNGKVTDAEKRHDIHWSGDNWKNVNHKNFSASSYSYNSDPYDAGAYSSADDFYYDYYNYFFDYEEAEEYWYEHN